MESPCGVRRKQETGGTKGTEWGAVLGRDTPSQSNYGVRRTSWAPQRGPVWNPGPKRILAYFESHKTLPFAPICWCFEFVKQCFMSHLGARPRFGAIVPHPYPNAKPPLLMTTSNMVSNSIHGARWRHYFCHIYGYCITTPCCGHRKRCHCVRFHITRLN